MMTEVNRTKANINQSDGGQTGADGALTCWDGPQLHLQTNTPSSMYAEHQISLVPCDTLVWIFWLIASHTS